MKRQRLKAVILFLFGFFLGLGVHFLFKEKGREDHFGVSSSVVRPELESFEIFEPWPCA